MRNTIHAAEQTFIVERKSEVRTASRTALLVHIYPAGPTMGKRYLLGGDALVIGRGEDCDILVDDYTASRRHARVVPADDGYCVMDLGSTNGTYVNNERTPRQPLKDGDYLRVGNGIFRFLAGGNVEAEYHEEIYRLTVIDGLTQTHNKRYLLEFLDRELVRCERRHRPLSLVLFDIDHFKRLNDTLGHLAGDFVLHELAARVQTAVRKDELFARYGGEEFAVVLPDTIRDEAMALAERIRVLVEDRPFSYHGQEQRVTVSLGVATRTGDEILTPLELIDRADERLYQAKNSGRNCVRA